MSSSDTDCSDSVHDRTTVRAVKKCSRCHKIESSDSLEGVPKKKLKLPDEEPIFVDRSPTAARCYVNLIPKIFQASNFALLTKTQIASSLKDRILGPVQEKTLDVALQICIRHDMIRKVPPTRYAFNIQCLFSRKKPKYGKKVFGA
ncbi:Hypothetical protein NTJ_05526 [Nesidiocoris tenuis]|uniref:Uncharacterized protein n=1 Tax=Nesidiocoris tenuis TaxID=355587 RepID=A0ABN7AN40_9HEMI|nr:Hypothetical protein NTJ_05526 [Nesidiocoris tenuis]